MATMNVLRKFGRKKIEHKESEARLKLQKELFYYSQNTTHGFPHKPTSMAFDPKLNLLAIGTKSGELRIVGKPGVEFSAHMKEDVTITQILFINEQGRLICLCSNNTLYLWELNEKNGVTILEEKIETSNVKAISTMCISPDNTELLLGTESGHVYFLNISTFNLLDKFIYQDVIMQHLPDDFKVNPGAVEALAISPCDPSKILIGYNRGLIALWDANENNVDKTYNASQQLESLSWHRDGTQFMTAHADGSYIIWSTADSSRPKEQANTPYGPFPCKAISKIAWKTAKAENVIVFSGGMPRPSYADRQTVSVLHGTKQVVFDFTSRIIDFLVLCNADGVDNGLSSEFDSPHSVVILAEEEMVVIDLTADNWPSFRLPYLSTIHASAITTSCHIHSIPEAFYNKLVAAGKSQTSSKSNRSWIIEGGKDNAPEPSTIDILITGHEDGTLRFWDVSSNAMNLLYKLSTANLFGLDFSQDAEIDEEEEWPPFRKVGNFDPYSDDPRLGIQKVALCPVSETLVIGGTAGQIMIYQFWREEREQDIISSKMNIVSDRESFVWKGHEALRVVEGDMKFAAGFQPLCVTQLFPPAACTAIAIQSDWQLIAVGTAHGVGIFDYHNKKEAIVKCTLNPEDLTGTGDSAMSRRKSFKKSLRESFRRLRRSRRTDNRRHIDTNSSDKSKVTLSEDKKEDASSSSRTPLHGGSSASTPSAVTPMSTDGTKTIERAIEFRSTEDKTSSMVRVVYFADTFISGTHSHTPTLWAGTSSGMVLIYQITVPQSIESRNSGVTCQLGKEIRLKHKAPVIALNVIDRHAIPLPLSIDVQTQRAKAPDMTGAHQVVICSEEQFKIFSLPHLKPLNKLKLTAHEGSLLRKVGFVNFHSRRDENYVENNIVSLTNQGDVKIYSLPYLKKQLEADVIRKDNINGINSAVLTDNGEGFYPLYPSELMRFSLSAISSNKVQCEVELKEGVRPFDYECNNIHEHEPYHIDEVDQQGITLVADLSLADTTISATNISGPENLSGSSANGDETADSIKLHTSAEGTSKTMNARTETTLETNETSENNIAVSSSHQVSSSYEITTTSTSHTSQDNTED